MFQAVTQCCIQNCIGRVEKCSLFNNGEWRNDQLLKLLRIMDLRTFKMLMRLGCSSCFYLTRLSLKGDSCNGGKYSKERIKVLLACNADGTDKIPLLVSMKREKPHFFEYVRKLLITYAANKKACATQAIFTNYLRALDAKMSSQNRKILLSTDQCSAHPQYTS